MIRIANVQGFWGDTPYAAKELLEQEDVDFLTMDYLAEVSLSIMAIQKEKSPDLGYAKDFLNTLEALIPFYKQGKRFKIVTNAGGLNPKGLAESCLKMLSGMGLKVGIVNGDDVLQDILENSKEDYFRNIDTNISLKSHQRELKTANAYVGSFGISEALKQGADIVITGRVADPCLVVGPCMYSFGWNSNEYDKIAKATVAGHLIECGRQVTGGINSFWEELSDVDTMGFPIVEVESDGSFVVTKPSNSGGEVSLRTVKEQLLYEIGDPTAYLSPDVTVSLENISLEQSGVNRVLVKGACGKAPTDSYKVNATYHAGYKSEGMLTIYGMNASQKAKKCAEIIKKRLMKLDLCPSEYYYECLGTGATSCELGQGRGSVGECVLRICVADDNKSPLQAFAKELAPLVTYGPPGVTGYASARPKPISRFGYWPCLIPKDKVNVQVSLIEESS
jgi:hypothetical protein